MMKRRTYEQEAENLSKAIDVAVDAFTNVCPKNFEASHQQHFINTYKEWKEQCLYPEPQYKKLASLKYIENDVFTYFQEGAGETVEYFWKKLKEQELPYERENKLLKILTRGKIKNRIEYEFVTDSLVCAQQNGMIDSREAKELCELIGKYESNQ